MSTPPARTLPVAALGVALACGLGFGGGFVIAKKQWFPHDQIVALVRGSEAPAEAPAPEAPDHTGWFAPLPDELGAQQTEEMLRELDELGYASSYGEAGSESGVVLHDPARSQAGLNLVLSAHDSAALLCDMDGEVLHEWRFPFQELDPDEHRFGSGYWRRVHLLEDGSLLAIWDRLGMIKLDRDSKAQWHLLGDYHHDLDVTADGTIWTLTRTERMHPRFSDELTTVEDFITRISPDGEVLGHTSLLEAFEDSVFDSYLDKAREGGDIFHTNTLEIFEGELAHLSPLFGADKALVSLRDLDVVAIVDLETELVVWAASGMWRGQHEPVVLDTGNLLVFDNMGHRGRSKVIELDPFTREVVWTYEGDDENDFYSALCGSNQRLSNGNTLITESLRGRAFEVTPDGEVVWRWVSPYRVGDNGIAVLMEIVRLEAPPTWLER